MRPFFLLFCVFGVAGRAFAQTESPIVAIGAARAFLAEESALVVAEVPIYVSTPLVVPNGPVTATLASGYVVPVHGGDLDGPWVGFVWVRGAGEVALAFPEPGPAHRFGMRMARAGGDVEALRPIVRREAPFGTTASEGLVLGATDDVAAVLEAYRLEKERVEADVDLVVTVQQDRGEILREARALLERRLRTWDLARVDVAEHVAIDRMRRDLYGSDRDGSFVLLDLKTATSFPLEAEESTILGGADEQPGRKRVEQLGSEWLSAVRDDTGEWDTRLRVEAFSLLAFSRDNVVFSNLSGEPFPLVHPDDPLSAHASTHRLVADHAQTRIKVLPARGDAMRLAAEIESRLVFRVEGAASVVRLHVPRGITDKGIPVDIALTVGEKDIVLALPGEDRAVTTVALPRTYEDGEDVVIDAAFTAYWPYGQAGELAARGGGYVEDVGLGVSSGLQSYLPTPAGSLAGNPWRFRTTVGVPPQEKLTVALSGETVREWSDPSFAWIEAAHEESPALWPDVAVGRWHTDVDPPHEDLPGVRVHLFTSARSVLTTFGPEVRRQVVFYSGYLPPFPYPELEVFEDTGQLFGFVWIAPHAMVQVKKAVVLDDGGNLGGTGHGGLRDDAPHLENAVLAHEVAHQYFGHVARPPSTRDFWIAETFAEGFSCMYVAAAFTKRACLVRMKAKREVWERDLRRGGARASLTDAYASPLKGEIVYDYGPYVMFEMLQRRIGTAAFFGALDGMLRDRWEQPITTEALQAYFEATSGQDLDDFFLFWVHGGYVPSVRLEWWHTPEGTIRDRVGGTVTADVPFGTFDLPVVLTVGDGTTRTLWVPVVDGVGELPQDTYRDPKKVEVDPEHVTLLRGRASKKVGPPSPSP